MPSSWTRPLVAPASYVSHRILERCRCVYIDSSKPFRFPLQ